MKETRRCFTAKKYYSPTKINGILIGFRLIYRLRIQLPYNK
jgi:hypothetical protein